MTRKSLNEKPAGKAKNGIVIVRVFNGGGAIEIKVYLNTNGRLMDVGYSTASPGPCEFYWWERGTTATHAFNLCIDKAVERLYHTGVEGLYLVNGDGESAPTMKHLATSTIKIMLRDLEIRTFPKDTADQIHHLNLVLTKALKVWKS